MILRCGLIALFVAVFAHVLRLATGEFLHRQALLFTNQQRGDEGRVCTHMMCLYCMIYILVFHYRSRSPVCQCMCHQMIHI